LADATGEIELVNRQILEYFGPIGIGILGAPATLPK
jgi:hypothetical protein